MKEHICMTKTIGAAILLFSAAHADAGVFTSVSAGITGNTPMKLSGSELGDVSSSEASVSVGYSAELFGGQHTLGFGYEGMFFDVDKDALMPAPEQLKTLSISYMGMMPIDDKWTGIAYIVPSWSNSGSSLRGAGFGIFVAAGASYKKSDTVTYNMGLGYTSLARDGRQVLPLLGVEWKISPDWTLSFGIPSTALTYNINEAMSLSLVAEGNFSTYKVNREDMNARGKTLVKDGEKMEYQDVRLGLSYAWNMSEGISLGVTGGYLFDRHFDYYESKNKVKSDSGCAYGSISISARF